MPISGIDTDIDTKNVTRVVSRKQPLLSKKATNNQTKPYTPMQPSPL